MVTSREGIDAVEAWSVPSSGGVATGGGSVAELGVVAVQSLDADPDTGVAFVATTSFDSPAVVHRLDAAGLRRWCPDPPDPSVLPSLTVTHRRYPSLDGTEIGIFVIHRADVLPSPDTSVDPHGVRRIRHHRDAGMDAHPRDLVRGRRRVHDRRPARRLRHGEAWHLAGRRDTKQNVFDDFHAAADWLVDSAMTSRDRLAIVGGSNGGLLMGVAITQRPDLARAVWCAVPLLDMIRFPQFLIARLWTDEYGDPDVAEEFAWLRAYSPYHNVVDGGSYPAVLFTTAEGDSRVDPLHARKMAALLTAASAGQDERPVLLAQAGRAGHGVGKPSSMRIDEGADVLTFLSWQLGVEHTLGD